MGGDDIFVLVLAVGFAVVSVFALRGSRGTTQAPPDGADDRGDAQ